MDRALSPLERVKPLLRELEPAAQRAALLICYFYAVPLNPEFLKEINEERDKLVRASQALRKLNTRLRRARREVEAALGQAMESWAETIRGAHMRTWDSALLPIPGEVGLDHHFRRKGIPDPAAVFDQFIKLWPQVEAFAMNEVSFLRGESRPIGSISRKYARQFWRRGRFEYVLGRLFKDFSHERKMRVRDIEERIESVLRELDRGVRPPDVKRGGVPAVREAMRRVANNDQHKRECENFIKSHLHFPTS